MKQEVQLNLFPIPPLVSMNPKLQKLFAKTTKRKKDPLKQINRMIKAAS